MEEKLFAFQSRLNAASSCLLSRNCPKTGQEDGNNIKNWPAVLEKPFPWGKIEQSRSKNKNRQEQDRTAQAPHAAA